jgi:hypothetical protein
MLRKMVVMNTQVIICNNKAALPQEGLLLYIGSVERTVEIECHGDNMMNKKICGLLSYNHRTGQRCGFQL